MEQNNIPTILYCPSAAGLMSVKSRLDVELNVGILLPPAEEREDALQINTRRQSADVPPVQVCAFLRFACALTNPSRRLCGGPSIVRIEAGQGRHHCRPSPTCRRNGRWAPHRAYSSATRRIRTHIVSPRPEWSEANPSTWNECLDGQHVSREWGADIVAATDFGYLS